MTTIRTIQKLKVFTVITLLLYISPTLSQKVKNVPEAFRSIDPNPSVISIKNTLNVPTENGHLQGVQAIGPIGNEKLLISGSSLDQAYILLADVKDKKTDTLIPLMEDPFRHAGGIQASNGYLVVGIEDNFTRTKAKVCVYPYKNGNLYGTTPNVTIDREGEAKRPTAGATGLLVRDIGYLMVVANWDARIWDFYAVDADNGRHTLLQSFEAPEDWASYQSINLVMDDDGVYAIGFYNETGSHLADLFFVSKLDYFDPHLEKIATRTFNCKNGADFIGAAGLQVDEKGKLHIWATQKEASEQIVVNRFSQD